MAHNDISNFSSSPHRLQTLSASQALQDLSSSPRKPIPSTLESLDAILQGRVPSSSSQKPSGGGLSRGQVTEVYGPPGVGKTTFALQVSASALHCGNTVVWVAASSGPAAPRLKEIVSGFHTLKNQDSPKSSPIGKLLEDRLSDFHHFATPTLPHLLALLTHESNSFPPKGTGLIVVDSVSSLFAAAFSRANDDSDNKQTPDKPKRNDAGAWAASRKWAVMGEFVSKLGKLAARNNIAVLLTSETTTRIRIETGAMLHPAISGTAWESGVSARIVLFRDWPFEAAKALNEGYVPGMRFAGISKAGGVSYERLDKIVSFIIDKHGLHEVILGNTSVHPNRSLVTPAPSLKRKRTEIGDSQSEDEKGGSDEEFGWDDDDDPLAAQELADG